MRVGKFRIGKGYGLQLSRTCYTLLTTIGNAGFYDIETIRIAIVYIPVTPLTRQMMDVGADRRERPRRRTPRRRNLNK